MIIEEITIGKPTGLEHIGGAFKGGAAGASISSTFSSDALVDFFNETNEYGATGGMRARRSHYMEKLRQESLQPNTMFQLSDQMGRYGNPPNAVRMDIPNLKSIVQCIGEKPLSRPGTAFAIHGNPSGPVIYVADPGKVICGSCRSQDAKMIVSAEDRNHGLRELELKCPKCNGVYTALEVQRDDIREKIYENR
jgi:hypothetical protein